MKEHFQTSEFRYICVTAESLAALNSISLKVEKIEIRVTKLKEAFLLSAED